MKRLNGVVYHDRLKRVDPHHIDVSQIAAHAKSSFEGAQRERARASRGVKAETDDLLAKLEAAAAAVGERPVAVPPPADGAYESAAQLAARLEKDRRAYSARWRTSQRPSSASGVSASAHRPRNSRSSRPRSAVRSAEKLSIEVGGFQPLFYGAGEKDLRLTSHGIEEFDRHTGASNVAQPVPGRRSDPKPAGFKVLSHAPSGYAANKMRGRSPALRRRVTAFNRSANFDLEHFNTGMDDPYSGDGVDLPLVGVGPPDLCDTRNKRGPQSPSQSKLLRGRFVGFNENGRAQFEYAGGQRTNNARSMQDRKQLMRASRAAESERQRRNRSARASPQHSRLKINIEDARARDRELHERGAFGTLSRQEAEAVREAHQVAQALASGGNNNAVDLAEEQQLQEMNNVEDSFNVATAEHVLAEYDYDPEEAGDLSMRKGDVVRVTLRETESGWWQGMNLATTEIGNFPSNFVSAFRGDTEQLVVGEETAYAENLAAARIQAAHRGRSGRRVYVEQRNAASRIQSMHRGRQGRDLTERERLLRQERLEVEFDAATTIQSKLREVAGRRQVRARVEDAEVESDSAALIQSVFRRKRDAGRASILRVEYDEVRADAAVAIQSAIRSKHGRRVAEMQRGRVAEFLQEELELKEAAAVSIQCIARGNAARRETQSQRQIAIMEELAVHEDAATSIQAAYRGRASRRDLEIQAGAAASIQAVYRGSDARKEVKLQADAAKSIQAAYRGRAERSQPTDVLPNSSTEAREAQLRKEHSDLRSSAASRIQSLHRGNVARKKSTQSLDSAEQLDPDYDPFRGSGDAYVVGDESAPPTREQDENSPESLVQVRNMIRKASTQGVEDAVSNINSLLSKLGTSDPVT